MSSEVRAHRAERSRRPDTRPRRRRRRCAPPPRPAGRTRSSRGRRAAPRRAPTRRLHTWRPGRFPRSRVKHTSARSEEQCLFFNNNRKTRRGFSRESDCRNKDGRISSTKHTNCKHNQRITSLAASNSTSLQVLKQRTTKLKPGHLIEGWNTLSFVPTPSVPDTSSGSVYPAAFTSNRPPNIPSWAAHPGRAVRAASGLIASTSLSPAPMSTPESL